MKIYNKIIPLLLVLMFSLLVLPQRTSPEELEILTFDQQLKQVFGDKAHLMKAIAMAESRLEEDQVSYNCTINGKNKPCKNKELAWSSDCGIFQVNVKGKECPEHLLTMEGNLQGAKKILDEQGLRAWVVYKSGAYKKYL